VKPFWSAIVTSAVLSVTVACGAQAAPQVLYWPDLVLGTDCTPAALSSLGITPTTASNEADFITKLNAGGWDLAILDVQDLPETGAQAALDSYVVGGGKAIYTDWTQNNGAAAAFDAAFTGNTNQTSMTVSGGLAAGITNPVTLSNPGWGVFSMGLSPLPGGSSSATFANSDAAIVIGNGGHTIINGFLNDTIANPPCQQLYENEISSVLGASPVPEPTSLALLATGGLPFLGFLRRRKLA
jgi:PEP-CTERM motif